MARNQPSTDAYRKQSGAELLLAPILGAVLFVVALAQSFRERRRDPGVVGAPGPDTREPEFTGVKARLARNPLLRAVLRVQTRFGELRGNNLAAAVALQCFLSIFPLLLVVVAVVGFFASSDASVGARIAADLGLRGDAARLITDAVDAAAQNPETVGPIGLVGLLWTGLGLVNALQYAMDQVWQVEERGMRDKLFGLVWLVGAGVLFVVAAAVTAALNWLPGFVAPVGIVVGVAVNFGLWLWSFKVLPNRAVPVAAMVPGAILGALGMEVLKLVGAVYLPRAIADSSALYGSIGVVFAVLAWLLLFSRLIVYATVLNVVRWERRAGTVAATIEVPAGRRIQRTDDVTRNGRVAREDAAA